MDTFENNDPKEPITPEIPVQPDLEPAPAPIPQPAPKPKTSPYADSPYVMDRPVEPPHRAPRQRRKPLPRRALLRTAGIVVLACLVTAFCINHHWDRKTAETVSVLTGRIEDLQRQIDNTTAHTPGTAGTLPVADGSALTPAQLYSANVDSVVAISSTVQSFLYGQSVEGASTGSGFVITENGYVVTNYHVVEDATSVQITTHDGAEYDAQVVGYDSGNDVAVLKVEAEGLSPVTIGSSSDLAIGDMVVAIGNPLGRLTSTQTVGYVSGIDREITTDNAIINMIQTDAAINSGNSGGPLFNMYGQVIGITTAKYSGTTGSGASIEGISFAIPIDDIAGMIDDLMDYGYVTGAYLGVTVQNNDAESAAKFGLPTTGAYVLTVEDGGAADRAGIRPKDIITELGGHSISTVTDLTRALRNFKAGDTTTVTIIRGGTALSLGITLDEKPHDSPSATQESLPSEGDFSEWYEYFRRYFGG